MALSQSQRLRKAAQKAARRKEIVAQKRKAEAAALAAPEAPSDYAKRAPIYACFVTEDLFNAGIGWVALARRMPMDSVAASFFMVDPWCLGVKDAFFRTMPIDAFETHMSFLLDFQEPIEMKPSSVRKLLHDAAAYAGSLGFAPDDGFAVAESLFGDIAMADETFTFGKDGKPHFVPGPSDSQARIRHVMETLAERGTEGVDFTIGTALGLFADDDESDDDGEAEAAALPAPPP